MAQELLRGLLEGEPFRAMDRRWRPRNLLVEPYRRQLLKNLRERYATLAAALPEFETLTRAERYVKAIYRMRLLVKQAEFAWRFDDLAFIKAISEFYSHYGTIMRFLSMEISGKPALER